MENKEQKLGRNSPCSCGSGKKYKQCCWKKEHTGPNLKLRASLVKDKMSSLQRGMVKTMESLSSIGQRVAEAQKEQSSTPKKVVKATSSGKQEAKPKE